MTIDELPAANALHLLPGRIVVRELRRASTFLFTPDGNVREERWHRARILAMGDAPKLPTGVPVPWGCSVGDEIVHIFLHHEKARTFAWPDDGLPAVVLTQAELLAVIEPV